MRIGKKTGTGVAVGVVLISLLSFVTPGDRYFEIARNLEIFATVFKQVNALYVDEVNPNRLMKTAIDAMLESLDPYTNYIPEDEVENFRTENTGQYGGIGIVTRQLGDRTVVTMVMAGYAGERGGIKIGDEIIRINEVAMSKLSNEEAGQLMKGQVGKPISLTVKRPGDTEPLTLQFMREHIKINNVPYHGMLRPDVGYIILSDFTQDAGQEVKNALVNLKNSGASKVILDLRGNPGGLLIEAVNVCNVFIPKGKTVVTTKGKILDNNTTYETLNNPTDTEIPLVILIDRGSASAAEIVAGTLQDYDRGVVLGERSYGKGLVQVSRPLSYNAQLKVTTAKYYTPSGRCIQVLDYSHRRADGSVARVPDSLKRTFHTGNNRVVYDGGGIEPDVSMEPENINPLTEALVESGTLFDYATRYASKLPAAPDPVTFELSDQDYLQFVTWAHTQSFDYKAPMTAAMEQLERAARRERLYEELKPSLETLEKRAEEHRQAEYKLSKDQIKRIISKQVVEHFFLESGGIQSSLHHDPAVAQAIDVLYESARYKEILSRTP